MHNMVVKHDTSAMSAFNVKSVLDLILVELDQRAFILLGKLPIVIGVELERYLTFNLFVRVFSAWLWIWVNPAIVRGLDPALELIRSSAAQDFLMSESGLEI